MSPGEREEKGEGSRNRQREPRYFFPEPAFRSLPSPFGMTRDLPPAPAPCGHSEAKYEHFGVRPRNDSSSRRVPVNGARRGGGGFSRTQPTSAGSNLLLGVSKRLEAKLPAKESGPGFYPHRRKKEKGKNKKKNRLRGGGTESSRCLFPPSSLRNYPQQPPASWKEPGLGSETYVKDLGVVSHL